MPVVLNLGGVSNFQEGREPLEKSRNFSNYICYSHNETGSNIERYMKKNAKVSPYNFSFL